MKPFDSRRWPDQWYAAACAISAVCLVATLFSSYFPSGPIRHVLGQLPLSGENNAAVWFAGMLLLVASLHAFDGFVRFRAAGRARVAQAWLAVAAILLVFCIDETASLHERMPRWLGVGSWLSLLPFGMVLVGLLAVGLHGLWSDATQRSSAKRLGIAFALFATVPVHEFLQQRTQWWGSYSGLRTFLEEGTEMAATLLVLGTAMRNSVIDRDVPSAGRGPLFDAVVLYRPAILTAALLIAPLAAYVTAQLPDLDRGRPADSLASIVLTLAALTIARPFLLHLSAPTMQRLALAGVALSMSVGAMALNRSAGPALKLSILAAVFLLFALLWATAQGARHRPLALSAIVLGVLVLLAPRVGPGFLAMNGLMLLLALACFVLAGAPVAEGAEAREKVAVASETPPPAPTEENGAPASRPAGPSL
jgi:hypothetical protein